MRKIAALWFILLVVSCAPPSTPESPIVPPALTTPTRAIATLQPTLSSPPSPVSKSPTPNAPFVVNRLALNELAGVGRAPASIVRLGTSYYVSNSESNNLTLIQNDKPAKYIPVGHRPGALLAQPASNRVFISNSDDKTLMIVNGDSIVRTAGIGDVATAMALASNRLFVGLQNKGQVLVLNPDNLQTISTVDIPKSFGIINLSADPAHHLVYAALYGKIAVIDSTTMQLVSVFEAKDSYYTLVVSSQGGVVFSNTYDSGTGSAFLVSYDPASGAQVARVKIGGDPRGAIISEDGTRIYVANAFTNDVSVIDVDKMSLVATIKVGMVPQSLALDESGHRLYVANKGSDNVAIIDVDSLKNIGVVPLAMDPTMLLPDEKNDRVYVSNASTDSIFVIERGHLLREIAVGHHPVDMALDAQSGRVFVANAADQTLSVIEPTDFSLRATQAISGFLNSVAVDASYSRVFAGSSVLDLKTLAPAGRLTMRGNSLGTAIDPDLVRVNPNNGRVYALAWNGTPGSNSRNVLYSIEGDSLQQRGILSYSGNVTSLAIDSETNNVFAAGTHPLAYTNELVAFDANDKVVGSLPLSGRTTGMVLNAVTHHLFLSHTSGYYRSYGPTPIPADDVILVLDTTSLGVVARLTVRAPGKMALLGSTVYVTGSEDGTITLIRDVPTSVPSSPTLTASPSPWPTPSITATRSATPVTTITVPLIQPTPCAIPAAPALIGRLAPETMSRLGCPAGAPRSMNFVVQPFERGTMYWREDQVIYVLYEDKSHSTYPDTWIAEPSDGCPTITVVTGLKPVRGFGKVWCERETVRARIGGATGAEHSFRAVFQGFQRGLIFSTDTASPVVISYEGKWE